jgi:arylsulfatase A-like enzyme
MTFIRFNQFRRALILLAVALEFSASADLSFIFTNSTPVVMPRRTSIIFIQCDGLGYGDLSCYGQTKFQTPNLDKFAAEGIRFTSYYAGDAASSPARAALLLGKDSGHLRQRADVDLPLAADDVTVAQILKQSGYHTGLIGEWDLGNENSSGAPWEKGFDEFAGYFDPDDAGNFYADYVWRYAPRSIYDKTNKQWSAFAGKEMIYPNTRGKNEYIPDLLTKAALNFIQSSQPDAFNHYRPFFLLLNYKIPGDGKGRVPTDAPFSDESWPQPEKNRAALISRLDGYIGQLVEQLNKLGMTNNVAIFFSGDTGPESGSNAVAKIFQSAGKFRGGRGELYEGGLRVPMIVRWPENIPAGQVSDFQWAAWDFLPTATDIALIKTPEGIDGISVLPTLLRQKQLNHHEFFRWTLRGRNVWHAVRMGDWEAVQPKADAPLELYNLKTDPGETQNVADKNPGVVKQLESILREAP